MDSSIEEIRDVVKESGVQVVQLHGDESPAMMLDLGPKVIKAIRTRPGTNLMECATPWSCTILVEGWSPTSQGGSGMLADWDEARALAGIRPVLLAGGLSPGNVGRAIEYIHPYGVDAASGIEEAPGIKNHSRMKEFVQAVRASDHATLSGEMK